MLFKSIFATAVLFAASAVALPTDLEARQQFTTCGDTYYSASQVNAAFNAGYNDYLNGVTYGNSNYPHQYNDYEGFDFPVDDMICDVSNGVYTGGSPGADRVVFNTNGEYAGAITHTGASGNDFVGCSGTD
ncbi:unnamed protein product [Aureobasidium mustum]|uniref:ribonuclease T1 n=1 Tax=Aureobasidium mustum TaxID=2773714 RepID=A0A9N8JF66_9PEZI|nr:unnamed protein product [Aureobasidium mustum]